MSSQIKNTKERTERENRARGNPWRSRDTTNTFRNRLGGSIEWILIFNLSYFQSRSDLLTGYRHQLDIEGEERVCEGD
jgi:hypothetical protein